MMTNNVIIDSYGIANVITINDDSQFHWYGKTSSDITSNDMTSNGMTSNGMTSNGITSNGTTKMK
jgi:hypothetical protein